MNSLGLCSEQFYPTCIYNIHIAVLTILHLCMKFRHTRHRNVKIRRKENNPMMRSASSIKFQSISRDFSVAHDKIGGNVYTPGTLFYMGYFENLFDTRNVAYMPPTELPEVSIRTYCYFVRMWHHWGTITKFILTPDIWCGRHYRIQLKS